MPINRLTARLGNYCLLLPLKLSEKMAIRRQVVLAGTSPNAGTWIETHVVSIYDTATPVAPLAGAWIETQLGELSLPNRQLRK